MFLTVHPETTGILFLILSLLIYTRMEELDEEETAWKYFYLGIMCIIFSALSKQIFFFTALPSFTLLNLEMARVQKKSWIRYFFSMRFVGTLLSVIFLGASTLFIMHPFAFFDYETTVTAQMSILRDHGTGNMALGLGAAWSAWLKSLSQNVFLMLMIFLSFTNILLNITSKRKEHIYIVSSISSILLTMIVFSGSRLFAGAWHYLMPIYPYYIISAISSIIELRDKKLHIKTATTVICAIAFSYTFIVYGWADVKASLKRLDYKNSDTYMMYEYISKMISNGSKVAISQSVVMSPDKGFIIFHWWKDDLNKLDQFDPDYMIYLSRFGANKKQAPETIAFKTFAKRMGYQQVKRIGRFVVLERPNR